MKNYSVVLLVGFLCIPARADVGSKQDVVPCSVVESLMQSPSSKNWSFTVEEVDEHRMTVLVQPPRSASNDVRPYRISCLKRYAEISDESTRKLQGKI
ncbi:hypothetical protein K2X30_14670 [bacterium]|jgi:hypothetical protein|nr:hypothetical protein [bacterium]